MKERRLNEIKGTILIALGFMVLTSLISFNPWDLAFYTSHPNIPPRNLLRTFGAYLGGILIFLFGRPTSLIIPLIILWLGVRLFKQKSNDLRLAKIIGILVLLLSVSSLIGTFNLKNETVQFYYTGFFGALISHFVVTYFGRLGGYIIFTTLIILSLALFSEVLISS